MTGRYNHSRVREIWVSYLSSHGVSWLSAPEIIYYCKLYDKRLNKFENKVFAVFELHSALPFSRHRTFDGPLKLKIVYYNTRARNKLLKSELIKRTSHLTCPRLKKDRWFFKKFSRLKKNPLWKRYRIATRVRDLLANLLANFLKLTWKKDIFNHTL